MYNILIGGAAGDGIDTMTSVLEKSLKKAGYNVFTTRDVMSRIRGGHNFYQIRFGSEEIFSHSDKLDGIIAMNEETIDIHKNNLNDDGFILCDSNIKNNCKNSVILDIKSMAAKLGNTKVSGSIAVGAILKIFGEKIEIAQNVIKLNMKEGLSEINSKALLEGFNNVESKYSHIKSEFENDIIITGNQAMALGAIVSGLRFYSAYPMSPSTSIMSYLSEKKDKAEIIVEQAEDEIAAINMAIGASYSGVRAMTASSGGGFCLMVEALGFCGIAEIPLVIADVQRPGPATGLPTRTEQSDLKFVISASQGEFPRMVISLKNHSDAFYNTVRAFNLADKYQIPVIILSDQYIADTSATIKPFDISGINEFVSNYKLTEEIAEEYKRYKLTKNGISPRLFPGKTDSAVSCDSDEHDEIGHIIEDSDMRIKMMKKRMNKMELLKEEIEEPEFLGDENCEILFVGFGSIYGAVKEAVGVLNLNTDTKYGALIFGDVFPLPEKLINKYSKKVKQIINIEQNATGQLASLIREYTGISCTDNMLKYDGRQISGGEIITRFSGEVLK